MISNRRSSIWKGQDLAYVRHQIFVRTWPPLIRGIGLSVSNDFKRWTKKELIFEADEIDETPWAQPHALAVMAYGDVLIGLLPMMDLIPEVGNNLMSDMHIEIIVSRDGRKWHRVADRARFIPQPKTERHSARPWDLQFHPASNMFVKDDKVYVYYFGSNSRWGEGSWRSGRLCFGGAVGRSRKISLPDTCPTSDSIGLATLPTDRFVSLRPINSLAEGMLQTKPLALNGRDLLVNDEIKRDELSVELLDSSKELLPGFERGNSKLVRHDKLRYRVLWHGKCGGEKRLGHAPRTQLWCLRFFLRNGDLYSFQVVK